MASSSSSDGSTSAAVILLIFLRLGVTSFGGPIAHIGYFRHEFVETRKWLDERSYADLVALCNFLPGPASSQTGIAIGILRAGLLGGFCAWLGFTLPSALALVAFGYGLHALDIAADAGWLHGLKVVAVAVIAQAVWGMGKSLCPDRFRASLAIAAAILVFAWPTPGGQIVAILAGGLIGWRFLAPVEVEAAPEMRLGVSRRIALASWIAFFGLLVLLPVLRELTHDHVVALIDSFYRTGALVFGGGHVVLPLIRSEVVPPGWVSDDLFLAGYGAAQAVPGPLFTFSAYLGAVMAPPPNGYVGAIICLVAIFLPAFLIVVGALPYWEALRRRTAVQSALRGVNAAVVGILLAALYDPVWTSTIHSTRDMALALGAFALLMFWKLPPLYVVLLSALGGAALAAF